MHQLPDDRLAEAYAVDELLQASEATLVYRAHARASGDSVVAKVLRLQRIGATDVHRLRFLKAVSSLIKHAPSGTAPLKDAAWGEEAAVLIFIPVAGTRLTQLTGLTPAQGAHLLARTGLALTTLHEAAIAHLNLAPDNILVASSEKIFLTGLGWGFVRLPASGAGFAAPELRKALDLAEPQRCDVFSFALLTAAFFAAKVELGEEDAEVCFPEEIRRQLKAVDVLEATLASCLSQDPFVRPASVLPLVEALEATVPPESLQEEGTIQLSPETEGGTVRLAVEPPSAEQADFAPRAVPTHEELAPPTPPTSSPSLLVVEPPSPSVSEPTPPAVSREPREVEVAPREEGEASLPIVTAPTSSPRQVKRKLWLWAITGFAAVVAGILLGFVVFSHKSSPPPARTPSLTRRLAAPTPTPLPQESVATKLLEEARQALASGELARAQGVLANVQGEALSAEEQALYQELMAIARQKEAEEALEDLKTAWKASDLGGVERALRRLANAKVQQGALSEERRRLVNQARKLQQLTALMSREEKNQHWEGALDAAGQIEKLFPGTREVAQAQERVALALERQAEAFAAQGKLQEALVSLRVLERYLPTRRGLAEKVARLQRAQEQQQRLRKFLEAAAALGNQGKPEQGLTVLAQVESEQGSKPEVKALRERLSQQLARLDSAPPTVAPPASGYKWKYVKSQEAKIEVLASDDHAVAKVTLFFRKKGEKTFRSMPMVKTSGGTYVGEVAPATHGNEDLQFYVVVEDYSGHQATLGSPDNPLDAKRKRGLFGL